MAAKSCHSLASSPDSLFSDHKNISKPKPLIKGRSTIRHTPSGRGSGPNLSPMGITSTGALDFGVCHNRKVVCIHEVNKKKLDFGTLH